MAASAMTIDGLAEFEAATKQFPEELRRDFQRVAETTGRKVQIRAQQTLGAALRKAIHITLVSDPAQGEVRVEAKATPAYPASMALWFEFGTAGRRQKKGRYTGRIEAKRYMQDAATAEDVPHRQALQAAAEAAMRRTFKG